MPALLFRYEEFVCFCCGGVGAGTSKQLDYQQRKILLEKEPLNFVICLTLNHTVALVLQCIKKMVNL
jgi:hypothetical protein